MAVPNVIILNRLSIGGFKARAVHERLTVPLQYLQSQGQIDLKIINETDSPNFTDDKTTHVILSRPYTDCALSWIEAAQDIGIKVVIDLDDLPLFRPQSEPSALTNQQSEMFLKLIARADIVTCSTFAIQSWIKKKQLNRVTLLIETAYDFERINKSTPHAKARYEQHILFTNAGPLKLGTFKDEWLLTMKQFLLKKNMRLAVYADYVDYFPPDFPFDYFGSKDWLAHKIAINEAFPLAVSPLVGEEDPLGVNYSQFKTPTKFICYSGLGIPTIYSKTPIYENVVKHKVNGLLARNTMTSWQKALEYAVENMRDLQQSVTISSTETQNRYNIRTSSAKWAQLLNTIDKIYE